MLSEVSHFINGISSYDTNIILAALVSLLLVILFVLLLHIYAKWFLSQARHRRSSSSVTFSHVLRPSGFHNFQTHHLEEEDTTNSPSKGLDASVIASIPLFVYKSNNIKLEQCVICLSAFEEEEIGRDLPNCGHGFHLECIDMWLQSHSNCPICRASVNHDFKVVETGNAMTEESRTEIAIADVSSIDSETIEINVMENNQSSSSSTSSAVASSLGNSLKRILSRSNSEHKVFPSELEA